MLEEILSGIEKPGRYIGGEWNAAGKDLSRCGVKFALCFPDLYEIGMSNLGVRILYSILNALPDIACERFFACHSDMEQRLRESQTSLFSLESARPLKDFDIVGFSLGYELDYTNVLSMLELGRLPLQASRRTGEHPLVIAGGPCAVNPEPMHEFFDLFVIGEAEEAIIQIIDIYRSLRSGFKSGKISKEELLLALSQIEGVYVPSLYQVSYTPQGKISGIVPRRPGVPAEVRRRFVRDLNAASFPQQWMVPYLAIVHDRITLEIMRGCPNSCRFCQARYQYSPLRLRDNRKILELACEAYRNSGYEEIALSGLSVSDFPRLEELLRQLADCFKEKAVGISLPSIKPKTVLGSIFSLIASVRKTGITFAPEAASERLRRVLNKNFSMEEFLRAVEQAYACGYRSVKLYFMTGIPSEEAADLEAIIELALEVSRLRRKVNKKSGQVNISINTLIPKPHTPFQWFGMEAIEAIRQKQGYLRDRIFRNRMLKANLRQPEMSFLEGVLCRGDRRLSQVILAAYNKGARFDAWEGNFNLSRWQEAFSACGIDPGFYLQEKGRDEILPWDVLSLGTAKAALIEEADKILAQAQERMYNQA